MAVRTFVFDLDGVVYRGEQALPGAVDTIETLRKLGRQVYFLTNNSTQTRTTYANKLRGMGIPAEEGHIMTSSYATALYLSELDGNGKTAFVVGEEGIRKELEAVGIRVVKDPPADYVVAGMDKSFDYQTLLRAQQAILGGAKFIATNRDATYPLEGGLVVPGGGALVAAIEVASGVQPVVIGKPETHTMHSILELAGCLPEEAVIIGDRLDTDVLLGKRIGSPTVLVLTGVTTEQDVEKSPEELRPDLVVHTLPEILGTELLQ